MLRLLPWLTALVIIGLDRITKMAIQDHLAVGTMVPVFPGLAMSHVHNRGIAFSLFANGGPLSRIVLHIVILTAVALIAWMLLRQTHDRALPVIGFGLILGGAIGNLVDRILHGWVIDFIHVWVRFGERTYSWPDFNVADSAISVGACLLVLYELRGHGSTPKNDESDESEESDHAPDPD